MDGFREHGKVQKMKLSLDSVMISVLLLIL